MAGQNQISVNIVAQVAGFKAAMEEAANVANDFSEKVKGALEGLTAPFAAVGKLPGILAEAFAAHEVIEFVRSMGELGEQTERTAAILGVTTEEVGKLSAVAAGTGQSAESLAMGMERFNANLIKAQGGTGPIVQGLKALGLSAKDFIGIPIDKQLGKLSDAVSQFDDGGNKTAAISLINRSMVQMIPLLDKGSKGIEELGEMAERTGTALSKETVEGMAQTNHGLTEMGSAFTGTGAAIFNTFKPAIDGLLRIFTDLIESFTKSVNEGGIFKTLLLALAIPIQAIDMALAVAIATLETLWEVGKVAAMELSIAFAGLGKIITAAFTFNLSGIKAAFNEMLTRSHQTAVDSAARLTGIIKNLTGELHAAFGGDLSSDSGEGHKKPTPPPGNDRATKQAEQIQKQILEQNKLFDDQDLALEQEHQAQLLALGKITNEQFLKSKIATAQAKANIDEEELAKARDIYPQYSAEWEKAETARVKATLAADLKIQQDMDKLAQEQMKNFKSLGDSINSSLTSSFAKAFEQIGAKTHDLRAVLQSFLKSLQSDFANFAAKQLVEGVIGKSVSAAGGGGGGIGGLVSQLFSGLAGHAVGGTVAPGQWAIAGEMGPELIYGGRSGAAVTPNAAMSGAGGAVNNNFNINVQGATGNAEVKSMIAAGMNEAIKQSAKAAPGLVAAHQARFA